MSKRFRPKFSISSLLIITAAISLPLAWYAWTAPGRARARSIRAEVQLMTDYGAGVGNYYYTWVSPPKFPILDSKGNVTKQSCGPHIDLTKLTLDHASFQELTSTLRDVIPQSGCSHVAVYLHSKTDDRAGIIEEAHSTLPYCVIFDETKL